MDDQDLGGDDLKYVSYSILFTKPDYEATLEEQKEELVSYATDGGSFGGLKIAKFFKKFEKTGAEHPNRPSEWDWDPSYAPADEENRWEIPREDEKYVTFVYCVKRRIPKQDADREKEKVRALKDISRKIG